MNIVWLSANKLGYEILKEAFDVQDTNQDVHLTSLITLSDAATTVMYDSVEKKKWHHLKDKHPIEIYEIERINDNNTKDLLKKLNPDLIIMSGWRQVLDSEVLAIPKKGVVAFHPTLLPTGRGPAPIINSILKGFKEGGLTMYYASQGLDDGDIIGQEKFTIQEDDYAQDVYEKVIKNGRKLIRKYLPLLAAGKAPRIKQDETKATVFEKPKLSDNKIDLEQESFDCVYRKIRALSHPYNGAYLVKDGKKLIIWKAEIDKDYQEKNKIIS